MAAGAQSSTRARLTNATRMGRTLPAVPVRLALLRERTDALEEVLAPEARLAQRDQLALDVGRQRALGAQQLADDALVAGQRQRGIGRHLGGECEAAAGELVGRDDLVEQPPLER